MEMERMIILIGREENKEMETCGEKSREPWRSVLTSLVVFPVLAILQRK